MFNTIFTPHANVLSTYICIIYSKQTVTYSVLVSKPTTTLRVEAIFTSSLVPYPKEISQLENQFVKLYDSHYFLSPYTTLSQKTTISLASTKIESYTKLAPHSVAGAKITYGPYSNVEPMAYSPFVVHYMNNKPFAKFSTVSRELEVSHWGNIAVEEVYELKHAGAILKGGFSRLDYRPGQGGAGSSSFRNLVAYMPKESNNIYYRDQIGNISTSDMRFNERSLELEIQSRFPLFGGWQTQFYIGYSVPTETALTVDENDLYKLEFDFFTIFRDVWVEDLEIKVILPEGCENINVNVPYSVKQEWSKRYTYLDYEFNGGRPVVTLHAKNIVKQHDKKVTVTYTFNKSRMLVEPMMLVLSFLVFFIIARLISPNAAITVKEVTTTTTATTAAASSTGKKDD